MEKQFGENHATARMMRAFFWPNGGAEVTNANLRHIASRYYYVSVLRRVRAILPLSLPLNLHDNLAPSRSAFYPMNFATLEVAFFSCTK